jgi:chromosome segregation ATPase
MADEYKIKIKTESDNRGTVDAEKAVDKLDTEIEQLINDLLDAKIGTKEFEEAQNKLRTALDKANIPIKELPQQLDKTGKAMQQVQGHTHNSGLAVLEFSRAFEDAQYGIRGVLNNIPTLLGHLGVGAGVAGVASLAAVALTTVLAPSLAALDEKFDFSGTKAKEMAEKLQEMADNLRKASLAAEQSKLDDYITSLDDMAEAQDEANRKMQAEIALQVQLRAAREATAASQNKLQLAVVKSEAAAGLISQEEANTRIEQLRAEGAQASADAAIAMQKDIQTKAQAAVEWQQTMVLEAQATRAGVERDYERTQKQYEALLEELRVAEARLLDAQVRAQEEADRRRRDVTGSNGMPTLPGPVALGQRIANEFVVKPIDPTQERDAVADVVTRIKALEQKFGAQDRVLKTVDAKIADAEQKLSTATNQLDETQRGVDAQIEKIETVAQNADTENKLDELGKKTEDAAKELATKVKETIDGIEPQNRLQSESLETLKKALEDGKITLNETQGVAQGITNMGENINGVLKEVMQAIQSSTQVQSANLQLIRNLRRDIDVLRVQFSQRLTQ